MPVYYWNVINNEEVVRLKGLYREKKLNQLEEVLALDFKNKKLLQKALTHRSFPNENKELKIEDNERLEFLGDSVLGLTVSNYIFHRFPDYPEGELAKIRSVIVSAPVLAEKARKLEIGKYLLLGRGEEMTGGRDRDSILADSMEALFAAIYLDRGLEPASEFIINLLQKDIEAVESGDEIRDYKTVLQEYLQQDGQKGPDYSVREEIGPDHNKSFLIEVNFKGQLLGTGTGSSKKEAEQKAARSALEKLDHL